MDTKVAAADEDVRSTARPTGRREAGKRERRLRIIHAARELIRETGNAGLSMRALAARAGVSLATPYNLFGSKRAIVLAVLQDIREFQLRFSSLRSADPIERIFSAVDIAMAFYRADPAFYKTLWGAVFDTTDEVRAAILTPERDAFWQGLIEDAAVAGVLRSDIDARLLQRHLDSLFRAVMLDWVVGELPCIGLAPTARMGYALVLAGACTPDWREPLNRRILESQAAALAARWPPVPPDRRDDLPGGQRERSQAGNRKPEIARTTDDRHP